MSGDDNRHSDAGELEGLHDVFNARDMEAFAQVVAAASDAKSFVTKSLVSQDHCRMALQSAYRVAFDSLRQVGSHTSAVPAQAPAELVTHNFHVEQIWAQIDMLHTAGMKRVRCAGPVRIACILECRHQHFSSNTFRSSCSNLMKHLGEDMQLLDESMEDAVDELLSGSALPLGRQSGGDVTYEDSSDSGASGDADGDRKLRSVDYDAMLAADTKHRKEDQEDHGDDDDVSMQSSDQVGSFDQDDTDDGAADSRVDSGDEDKELLPTEDDFLRLEDMERFLQHGDAAEAAGDLGGFDNFQDFLEGHDIGGGKDGTEDDEDAVDLYGRWDSGDGVGDEDNDDDDDAMGMMDGSAITYADFFGHSAPYQRSSGALDGSKRRHAQRREQVNEALAQQAAEQPHPGGDCDSGANDSADEGGAELSTHERRQRKIAAQIAQIEEDAMKEQSWHLRGEATAATRPKDSALEIDVDFERTMRPPPEPTFEAAVALEDVIKARILEMRFDNVVRVVPGGPQKERRAVDLNDAKAKQGLAEEYEAGLKRTLAGTSEDRSASTRKEIHALFKKLSSKLDALSHLGLAAKPVITDLEVKVDAPAIAMEEAAPVMVSAAALKAPEEAAQKRKDKQLKEDDEQTQAERRQARASKKRIRKRKDAEKEEAAGVYAHDKGIKSAREDAAAEQEARMASKKHAGQKHTKKQSVPTTAAAVFKQLQDEKNGVKKLNAKGKGNGVRSAALML